MPAIFAVVMECPVGFKLSGDRAYRSDYWVKFRWDFFTHAGSLRCRWWNIRWYYGALVDVPNNLCIRTYCKLGSGHAPQASELSEVRVESLLSFCGSLREPIRLGIQLILEGRVLSLQTNPQIIWP